MHVLQDEYLYDKYLYHLRSLNSVISKTNRIRLKTVIDISFVYSVNKNIQINTHYVYIHIRNMCEFFLTSASNCLCFFFMLSKYIYVCTYMYTYNLKKFNIMYLYSNYCNINYVNINGWDKRTYNYTYKQCAI